MENHLTLKKANSWGQGMICMLLALMPVAYLTFLVFKYDIDVPYLDQWGTVTYLEKYYQGTLTFEDIWQSYNMQRIPVPRTTMILLASFTTRSFSYELAINIFLGIGILTALIIPLQRMGKVTGDKGVIWLIPVFSLMVFALNQWENWSWGFQMCIFLNVFAAVTGIIFLSRPVFKWYNFIAATVMGFIATFSFASGVSYWLIGLLILWVVAYDNEKTRKLSIFLWVLVGSMAIFLFFHGIHRQPGISFWVFLEKPVKYLVYFFTYLGAPLVNDKRGAFYLGVFGIILGGYLCWFLIRRQAVKFSLLVPFLALGLYAISSALITGVGRVTFGTVSALSSRYITISSLFWVAMVFLLYLFAGHNPSGKMPDKKVKLKQYAGFFSMLMIVLFISLNSALGSLYVISRYDYLWPARQELLVMKNDYLLKRLHPRPEIVREQLYVIKKHHFSVFRDRTR